MQPINDRCWQDWAGADLGRGGGHRAGQHGGDSAGGRGRLLAQETLQMVTSLSIHNNLLHLSVHF